MASTTATRRSGRYYVTRNAEGKLIHVPIDDQRGKYYVARDANGKLIKVPMGQEPPTSASSIDNNTAAVASAVVAAAKKKSKLTDAERTRLKGVLKEALSRVQLAVRPDGYKDSSEPSLMLYVNARQDEFQGEFSLLWQEILLEEPQVLHAFMVRSHALTGGRGSVRLPLLAQGEVLHVPGESWKPEVPVVDYPVGVFRPRPPKDLVHPDDYYGFLAKESKIEITIPVPGELPVAHANILHGIPPIHIGSSPSLPLAIADATIEFSSENSTVKIDAVLGFHTNTIELVSKVPTYYCHVLYQHEAWRGKWIPFNIPLDWEGNREFGHYFDPDLFDNIRVTIRSRYAVQIAVAEVSVVLNNDRILESNRPLVVPVSGSASIMFDRKEIRQYKRRSLLWQRKTTYSNPQYDPDAIMKNRFLRIAVDQLGKAWCRRYGSDWEWGLVLGVQGTGVVGKTTWNPAPDFWCGSFTSWVVHKEGSLVKIAGPEHYFPQPNQWQTAKWYYDNHRHYNPFNTKWENLGLYIKPGDYINLWGHAAFFINWIEPPPVMTGSVDPYVNIVGSEQQTFAMTINKFCDVLDPCRRSVDDRPGVFHPDYDINWFRYLGGNSGGGRVTFGVGAVINLDKWTRTVIDLIFGYVGAGVFVPWCKDSSFRKDWDDQVDNSPPGFGRTDGKEVVDEFRSFRRKKS